MLSAHRQFVQFELLDMRWKEDVYQFYSTIKSLTITQTKQRLTTRNMLIDGTGVPKLRAGLRGSNPMLQFL